MKLVDCYRVLGLKEGATYEEIKASYRRLARRYHPDVNRENPHQAQELFIQITEAYERLITEQPKANSGKTRAVSQSHETNSRSHSSSQSSASAQSSHKKPNIHRDPEVPLTDHQMKVNAYDQVQQLLQERRFPRAIALLEGLYQRMPNDREAREWLAIAYYKWGVSLISTQDSQKARLYLNKALRTAPDYRDLWFEVDRAMQRLDAEVL